MRHSKVKHSIRTLLTFLGFALVFEVLLLFHTPAPKAWSQMSSGPVQQPGSSLIGYLWSDNIGWIDLNCLNTSSCATNPFGIAIDNTGNLSGYAWSDNIGWISANSSDLIGCPSSPCIATFSGTALSGWFRAVAGTTTPPALDISQAGGWDGFISLSNVTYASSTNYFAGYGWGSLVTGWVDFSKARQACTPAYSCNGDQRMYTDVMCQTTATGTPCSFPRFCSSGSNICLYPPVTGTITATPKIVVKGKTVSVSWSATGVSTSSPCTVTNTNDASVWTGASGTHVSQGISSQTTFTLSCTPYDPSAPHPYTVSTSVSLVPSFVEQ